MNNLGTNEHDSSHNIEALRVREQALQDAAERGECDGLPPGDPAVDTYRLVLRGVRQAPTQEIPADFAQSTLRRLQATQQADLLERLLTQILVGLLAVGGSVLALPPTLAAIIGAIRHEANPALQWPLILSAALALELVWAIDRAWTLRGPPMQDSTRS